MESLIVYILVFGIISFLFGKLLRKKDNRIEKLEKENDILHLIIRQANVSNKPPKDLDDEMP